MALTQLLHEIVNNDTLIAAVLSDLSNKGLSTFVKLGVKPFDHKGERMYQLSYDYGKKVLHKNLTPEATVERLQELIGPYFKQAVLFTENADIQLLYHKKNGLKVIEGSPTKVKTEATHNRAKKYILMEGEPVDFMVALGIMNAQGKVLKEKYAKFRQINKYLEFIEDAIKHMPHQKVIRILDFGCGKAYLTFATHYYILKILGRPAEIIGLDLKAEVIQGLNTLKDQLGYEGLTFLTGDIRSYRGLETVDLVISLHACDVATDFALEKAVSLGASAILAVPCCQHELNGQLKRSDQEVIYGHGILKERFAAILTDSLRAAALEAVGYEAEIVEFIDMEHTPKNLLIRAYKRQGVKQDARRHFEEACKQWGVEPMIGKLLLP